MRHESLTLGYEELIFPVTAIRIERGREHSAITIFINHANTGHITVKTSELDTVIPLFVNSDAVTEGTRVMLEEMCRKEVVGELPDPYEPQKSMDDPSFEPNISIKWIEYYNGYSVKRVKVNDDLYFYGKMDDGDVIKGVSVADVEEKINKVIGGQHERDTKG